jgi:hypothetical protein
LAERLGVSQDSIAVKEIKSVEWPDTSLGCPQPGTTYAQVITPGYEIVLRVKGQVYVYHTGGDSFVLCQDEKATEPTATMEKPKSQEAALVEQAKADLSNRLEVAQDAISLLSVEAVQWPDSSMGCPQPGMRYLMVVTPGYLIQLEVDSQTYEYHGNEETVFYCKNPKPLLDKEAAAKERLLDAAKADLAQRLSIRVTDIQTVHVQAVQWPDASLGCPQPGMMYAQVVTPGYQIILAAKDREYAYHANLDKVLLCEE